MEMNGKANRNADGTSIRKSAEQAGGAAHATVDRLASGAHRVVDKAVDAAGSTIVNLSQRREQVTEKGNELVDDLRNYVQANPLASIGIAAAIGFVFSRIVAARSDES